MAFATDKEVKEAIKTIITGADTIGDIRVITRWKLSLDPKDWKGALRSLTSNDRINGFIVTRTSRKSKRVAPHKWEYRWKYTLLYFKSIRDNGATDNSENEVNVTLEAIAQAFEDSSDLGFTAADSGVDEHEELQVINIDSVDDQVHVAHCELTVLLTKQR